MATMSFEVIAGPGTWQSVSEAKREAYVPLGVPATKARAGPRETLVGRHTAPSSMGATIE